MLLTYFISEAGEVFTNRQPGISTFVGISKIFISRSYKQNYSGGGYKQKYFITDFLKDSYK